MVRWVLAWCAFYTRDVDGSLAAARRDELASDLFDQALWADEVGLGPRRVAATIAGRSARGVAADLHWRHTALRATAHMRGAGWAATRRGDGFAAALVAAVGLAVVSWGVYVIARTSGAAIAGEIAWGSQTFIALCGFTLAAACGLLLLLRRRTRTLGALWMVLPSAALVHLGLFQLFSISATAGVLMNSMPTWGLANGLAICGLIALFIAAAAWWWPERATPSSREVTR